MLQYLHIAKMKHILTSERSKRRHFSDKLDCTLVHLLSETIQNIPGVICVSDVVLVTSVRIPTYPSRES